MNRDQWAGGLEQAVGIIEEYWGNLRNDPVRAAAGRRARCAGKIRARCGLATADAERQLGEFLYRHRHWKITA